MLPTILLTGLLATAGVKATAGVTSVITAPGLLPDWATSMAGVWYLEEGSTTTRASSGTCTTSCGLSRSGDATNDAANKMQGSYSNTFDNTGDYLSCTNANCGSALGVASSGGTGGSVSWGCWVYLTGNDNGVMLARTNSANSAGYSLNTAFNFLAFDLNCRVDSTNVTRTADSSSFPGNWMFVACSFDDTANSLTLFFNGSSAATGSPNSIASVSDTFYVGSGTAGTNGDFGGNLDECFVYKGAIDALDACRICSCGIDGSLCTYDTSTLAYIQKGRNVSYCGSCTLPTPTNATP